MRKVNLAFLIGAIVLFILAWATGHKEVHIFIAILWAITALIGQVELVRKDRVFAQCMEELDNIEKKIKSECVPVDVMCEWLDIYDVRVEGEKASDVIRRVSEEAREKNENA